MGTEGCVRGVFSSRGVPDYIAKAAGVSVISRPGPDWWEEARKHQVVIVWFEKVTAQMLSSPGCIRLLIARSSGYDHIDIKAAEHAGICVANQPEVIAESVAEHALAGILAAARSLPGALRWVPRWAEEGWPGLRLRPILVYGRSIGLLGAGRIAAALMRRLAPFSPSRVLYYSRNRKPWLEHHFRARRARLEDIFRDSEIVVNSLPLTPETRGLVKLDHLLSMPKNAIYVNVGRGGTEEPGAVCEASRRRPDIRIVADVHPWEPLPQESPRLALAEKPWNVLTPHMAGASMESSVATTLLALLQARDYLEKGCVWNPVNRACPKPCGSPYSPVEAVEAARRILQENEL
ncbi:MAG: 2-hydroxyacid dehydrogenase [Desulfurococcales archaeon]|nr:2-hydroxyacid dehydrogenase [Desulfurococcales archaeon]